ncbi:MAG: hypothetical protein ACFFAO_02185 [Candidatus Hermodarchaeota archaeon]
MLYDYDFAGLIGIGILIGVPLALTFYSEEKFNVSILLIYMTIVNAFLVSVDILPLWTQVLFLVLITSLIIIDLKSSKRSDVS